MSLRFTSAVSGLGIGALMFGCMDLSAGAAENASESTATVPTVKRWEPRFVSRAAAQYPAELAVSHATGCVVLEFEFRPDGTTDNFVVLDSNPPGLFDKSAISAAASWRIEPDLIPRRLTQPFLFEMKGKVFSGLPIDEPVRMRSSVTCVVPTVTGGYLRPLSGAKQAILVMMPFPPYYPSKAALARVQGCVTISFSVGPDGKADQYEIVNAEPQVREFADATLQALNQLKFVPSLAGTRYEVRYDFSIRDYAGEPVEPVNEACAVATKRVENGVTQ